VESEDVNQEDVKKLNQNLVMFAREMGVGVEYFFDQNFSIGGEFGLRYFNLRYKDEYQDELYNDNTNEFQNTTIKTETSFTSNPTYSKISLNFYSTKKPQKSVKNPEEN